jgi:type I restriction enzyme, S subunit
MSAWCEATLSDVAVWGSGGTPQARNPAYYGGDIPWAVIGDLNDGIVRETKTAITETGLENSSAKVVPSGTILLAMYGSIGKLGLAGRAMATNQAIATARATGNVEPKYLFYYLLSQRSRLDAAGKGATQRNISQSILKPWPIRFPVDLDEQRRIVDLLEDHLSRLDAAEDGLVAGVRRMDSLARSALDRWFGGPVAVALDDLVDDISAGRSFGASSAPARDGEWGIIKVSAMTWGEFRPDENKAVASDRVDPRFEIRSGDLLVSRANTSDYVGSSVLVGAVRPRLLLSDKSLRVTPRPDVDPAWLWRALQAPSARRQISALATGTKDSMRNISQPSLRKVLLPSVSSEDQAEAVARFKAFSESTQHLSDELTRQRSRSKSLRRALLAAAFSGRLTATSEPEELIHT